jgi:ATP-binding cassette subfamily C protein CydC
VSGSILRTAQPPLRRSWRGLVTGALSALSGIALLATSAYLITRAAEQPPILYLSIAIVSVRLFALTRASFRYLERLTSHDAAFRQLAVVRTELYRRLVRVAPAGLARTSRGDLLTRVVSDVDALQDLPLRVVQPLVISGLSAVASVVGVAVVEPRAAVVLAVGLVVAFAVTAVVADRLARSSETSLAERRGALGAAVLDTLQNLDVLVAFDAVDGQLAELRRLDGDLRAASLRRASTSGLVAGLVSLLSGATVVAVVWAVHGLVAAPAAAGAGSTGLSGAVGAGLTGPAFALVALVPLAVFEVVGSVPVAVLAWRRVRASAERVDTAAPVRVPPEVVVDAASPSGAAGPVLAGPVLATPVLGTPVLLGPDDPALRLTGVSASWPGASHPALSGLDLEVGAGERLVIEGPSGAGKSTLASVLVRFLEFSGEYRLGGTDVRDLDPEAVRAQVGLLEQQPYLFDENVRQNLLFARDTATDADLEGVLERVGLGSWLRERGGLDARLGERGALVSGGQAQRISLARALLRGFPILVLDEPAAGVDAELADALLDDVLATAREDGTTVLLISHVPVPPEHVTRRLVLRGGAFEA